MKTIVITGPSGSGKTYLSNRLSKLFDDSIVIKTDSFYKDNLLIKFLSILKCDIYDRTLSIKKNKLMNTLSSIYNKDQLVSIYNYDFKRRQSSKSITSINYKDTNQFLILEGIFSHRLGLNYKDAINILCVEDKEICFKRRLKRDKLERERNDGEVNRRFNKSWNLFYQNIKDYLKRNKIININSIDKYAYDELIINLQNIKNNN